MRWVKDNLDNWNISQITVYRTFVLIIRQWRQLTCPICQAVAIWSNSNTTYNLSTLDVSVSMITDQRKISSVTIALIQETILSKRSLHQLRYIIPPMIILALIKMLYICPKSYQMLLKIASIHTRNGIIWRWFGVWKHANWLTNIW